MSFEDLISLAGYGIEAVGVLVIIAGSAAASLCFLGQYRKQAEGVAYRTYRRQLGRSIILGLEFLIAGDIIRTVVVADKPLDERLAAEGVGILNVKSVYDTDGLGIMGERVLVPGESLPMTAAPADDSPAGGSPAVRWQVTAKPKRHPDGVGELVADPLDGALDSTDGVTPAQTGPRLDRLVEVLGLNEDQVEALAAAYTEFRTARADLRDLVRSHVELTGSVWGEAILEDYRSFAPKFWLVKPKAAELGSLFESLRQAA